jgi:anti-sigma B factor antagonist
LLRPAKICTAGENRRKLASLAGSRVRDEIKLYDNESGSAMNASLEKINGYSVVNVLDERIDAHNSAGLKEMFLRLIEQGEAKIVVQLDKVRFIDSSGLGALLSGHKNLMAKKSGRFILAGCKQQVLSMFELTRLNRIFEIYSDLTEALENEN